MDLDFTSTDIGLDELQKRFYALFHENTHYAISFEIIEDNITPESYFAVVKYSHPWNPGDQFEFQVSFREQPILPITETYLFQENYFKYLEFPNFPVRCLQKEELLLQKYTNLKIHLDYKRKLQLQQKLLFLQ